MYSQKSRFYQHYIHDLWQNTKKNNVNFIHNESQVSQSNLDKMYMLYICLCLHLRCIMYGKRNKIERYANTMYNCIYKCCMRRHYQEM